MLEETSFAIQPDREPEVGEEEFFPVGTLARYETRPEGYRLICNGGTVHVTFFRDDIVRVSMACEEAPDWVTGPAVVKSREQVEVAFDDAADRILLKTHAVTVRLEKSPFRVFFESPSGEVRLGEASLGMGTLARREPVCFKDKAESDHYYGFGEKTGFLDKRGQALKMWNSDVFAPHNPETDALYQSIPFFLTLRGGRAHGLFLDNSSESHFDFKSWTDRYSISAKGGQLDYYFFAGPTPKAVLEQYSELTGRMPLPPKWALGYHQSRYSYKSEAEVRELVATFRDKGIPLDVVHLDIHYMRGYRVFTFDAHRFPDPRRLMEDLKGEGVRVVPIVDPGVKVDPEYTIYREGVEAGYFCRYLEGGHFFGDVWPGTSAFPDLTDAAARAWWGEKHRFYTDLGVEGIWNDMNEPAVFNETKTMDESVMHQNDGDPKTHRLLHNLYGFQMSRATYEGLLEQLGGRRPFVLTRAGFAGEQRYAAVWTGDNRSFWEHLEMALPMVMNLGLSGVAFAGPDVGGFAHDTDGELLTRWTQAGALMPFFRNHSAIGTARQEPWAFGEPYEGIIKRYIQLRYEWLPHLYTLFEEAARTGLPVMRPLMLEYPDDPSTYNLSDQFLVGGQVLVAPILRPDRPYRAVYLPEGEWIDYWTDRAVKGEGRILVDADLGTLPIYIRSGSILPHGEVKQSTERTDHRLVLHLYPGGESVTYSLYEDDGTTFAYESGEQRRRTITCCPDGKRLHLTVEDEPNGYIPTWQVLELIVHRPGALENVVLGGRTYFPDPERSSAARSVYRLGDGW